ncbi:hypothetical protein AOLI_G00194980 [Acnodon oligacanthus]
MFWNVTLFPRKREARAPIHSRRSLTVVTDLDGFVRSELAVVRRVYRTQSGGCDWCSLRGNLGVVYVRQNSLLIHGATLGLLLVCPPLSTSYLCSTNHVAPREVLATAGEVLIENNPKADGSVCPSRAPLPSLDEHRLEEVSFGISGPWMGLCPARNCEDQAHFGTFLSSFSVKIIQKLQTHRQASSFNAKSGLLALTVRWSHDCSMTSSQPIHCFSLA